MDVMVTNASKLSREIFLNLHVLSLYKSNLSHSNLNLNFNPLRRLLHSPSDAPLPSPTKLMAAGTTSTVTEPPINRKTRVCFSFAAYSKDLIARLHHHYDVPIVDGLTQTELSGIESTFHFSFPPDLRSILQEGLPVGHGFPNWRSSSPQQLEILLNLPILGLCKEVQRRKFWHRRWGDRPEKDDEAVELAKGFLKNSPVLVPVYRNCYIPSTPCIVGNPVFYVNGLDVKLWSYDVVGFFRQTEFKEGGLTLTPTSLSHFFSAPVWAATAARRVEFWTELTEVRLGMTARGVEMRRRWWRVDELGRCLEDVRWKLIAGGWTEEDVDEMMMMMVMDGGDEMSSSSSSSCSSTSEDGVGVNRVTEVRYTREGVGWHVRALSMRLLRAGWSRGDVMDSLGCLTEDGQFEGDPTVEIQNGIEDSLFDFEL